MICTTLLHVELQCKYRQAHKIWETVACQKANAGVHVAKLLLHIGRLSLIMGNVPKIMAMLRDASSTMKNCVDAGDHAYLPEIIASVTLQVNVTCSDLAAAQSSLQLCKSASCQSVLGLTTSNLRYMS